MSTRPWMPLYIADYLADTLDLSFEQHGVYLLMLMLAWRQPTGCLPDDMAWLKRSLGLHGNRFNRLVPPILARFWTLENGAFHQNRLGKEREKARKFLEKQKFSARKRWSQTKENNVLADAKAMPARVIQPQSHKRDTGTPYLPTLLPNQDSQIEPKEKIQKKEVVAKPKPLDILKAALCDKTAQDVLDHRKALRKPLTARGAELLAQAFNAHGDPERAAEAMIVNGWQGFKPEWLSTNGHGHVKPAGRSNGLSGYARLVYEDIERDTQQELDNGKPAHKPAN